MLQLNFSKEPSFTLHVEILGMLVFSEKIVDFSSISDTVNAGGFAPWVFVSLSLNLAFKDGLHQLGIVVWIGKNHLLKLKKSLRAAGEEAKSLLFTGFR